MIAVCWEQIIRWQGQEQRDELEGNYSNPGMRRWCLSTYCEFNAVCIVYRDQCKRATLVYFSVSAYFPLWFKSYPEGKKINQWRFMVFLVITGNNMNLACIWFFIVFQTFLHILPHLALAIACVMDDRTCHESCSCSLLFTGVCILASLNTYTLSNNQKSSILEDGIWVHLKKFTQLSMHYRVCLSLVVAGLSSWKNFTVTGIESVNCSEEILYKEEQS